MLNALLAPAAPASQAPAKGPVGKAASANNEGAGDGFAQLLDHATTQPPNGPDGRQRDKVRGLGRGLGRGVSSHEPAKAEPVPRPLPAQVDGKDRSTVPPESEADAEVDRKVGLADAPTDPTSPQGVPALLAELRAAAPAATGAARRGGDASAAISDTPSSALPGSSAAARVQRGDAGSDINPKGGQKGSPENHRESFGQQLSAASGQDGSTLRGDTLPTVPNPPAIAATAATVHAQTSAAGPAAMFTEAQLPATPGSAQFGAQLPAVMFTEAQLPATPGSAQFGAQLGAQISTFVQGGVEHARLHLNPAEMGPVSVQIQIDGQTALVHLSAENAHTRQALEQAMPMLASSLREAGLTLSGGGVFEQARQGGGAQTGHEAGHQTGHQAGSHAGNGSQGDDTLGSLADEELHAASNATPARRRGVVDLVA